MRNGLGWLARHALENALTDAFSFSINLCHSAKRSSISPIDTSLNDVEGVIVKPVVADDNSKVEGSGLICVFRYLDTFDWAAPKLSKDSLT